MVFSDRIFALLSEVALLLPVFMIIFTWRGFCKALTAWFLGDDTAREAGFLTLNPGVHLDIFGLLIFVSCMFFLWLFFPSFIASGIFIFVLFALGIHWTHQVPFEDGNFYHYRLGGVLFYLSSPLGLFVLAYLSLFCMVALVKFTMAQYILVTLISFLKTMADLAIFFGVLGLLPIPPFEGVEVIRYLLPDSKQHWLDSFEQYSLFIFMALIFFPGVNQIFFGTLNVLTIGVKKLLVSLIFLP